MSNNPFHYRSADIRYGILSDTKNFVELFSAKTLRVFDKYRNVFLDVPLLIVSSPGGGKTSLMRIFANDSIKYLCENPKSNQSLFENLDRLGCFRDKKPHLVGLWLLMTKRYNDFLKYAEKSSKGYFYSFFNSRIIILFLKAIFFLNDLNLEEDHCKVKIKLKDVADHSLFEIFEKYNASNIKSFFKNMVTLESQLFDLINDPFWEGNPSELVNTDLWSLKFITSIDIFIDNSKLNYLPLIMIDDFHNLKYQARKLFFEFLSSRKFKLPFWISTRKKALPLEKLLSTSSGTAINRGRDYEILDLNKDHDNFSDILRDILKLRVSKIDKTINPNINKIYLFIDDNKDEINFNISISEINSLEKQLKEKYRCRIKDIDEIITKFINRNLSLDKISISLTSLDIFLYRKVGEDSIFNQTKLDIDIADFKNFESRKDILNVSKLFLAKQLRLPYYCGIKTILKLSSNNIDQFLSIFGQFYDELSVNYFIKRQEWKAISLDRQNELIHKLAYDFLNRISKEIPYGKYVSQFIRIIGRFCNKETYKNNAPYAPGVTGIALLENQFEQLMINKNREYEHLYRIIKSSIANNLLEPVNKSWRKKSLIVLYLNRLLCCNASWHLPIQKGGFREMRLDTLIDWTCSDIEDFEPRMRQLELW